MSWLELWVPFRRLVNSLTSNTCERVLIWEKALCTYNQVKMRSLEWILIEYNWYFYKKRKCHVKSETEEEGHVTTEVEIAVIHL